MPKVCILSSVHLALDNRVFYREARSLIKAGYEVTLIAVHPRDEIKDGVHIIGLPKIPRWQRPRLWVDIFQRARAENADIYHFHDPELLLVTPWLRWMTGKPTIYDIHEVYADFIKVKDYLPVWLRYPIAWIFRWLEPLLTRLQSALIFSDDEISKTFDNINCPKTTLFNFPSIDFVKAAKTQTQSVSERSPIILHLGGHERNRGTQLMIEAFSQVIQSQPDARLLLVGHFMPPNLEEEVRAQVKAESLNQKVTITGRVPFEKIGDYLTQAAVGWVPWQPYPKNEKNIPTKLFEYMAYGVPVVASDLASTRPFVINAENGYCVTASDPSAHAQAILEVLKNPKKARWMGQSGQDDAQNRYNWNSEESKLWALYESILG